MKFGGLGIGRGRCISAAGDALHLRQCRHPLLPPDESSPGARALLAEYPRGDQLPRQEPVEVAVAEEAIGVEPPTHFEKVAEAGVSERELLRVEVVELAEVRAPFERAHEPLDASEVTLAALPTIREAADIARLPPIGWAEPDVVTGREPHLDDEVDEVPLPLNQVAELAHCLGGLLPRDCVLHLEVPDRDGKGEGVVAPVDLASGGG